MSADRAQSPRRAHGGEATAGKVRTTWWRQKNPHRPSEPVREAMVQLDADERILRDCTPESIEVDGCHLDTRFLGEGPTANGRCCRNRLKATNPGQRPRPTNTARNLPMF